MAATLSSEIEKFAWSILKNAEIVTCTDELRIDKLRSGLVHKVEEFFFSESLSNLNLYLKIIIYFCSSSSVTKENGCDRFRLLIPYGGTTLSCKIKKHITALNNLMLKNYTILSSN